MAVSRVKSSKQRARLKARRDAYDAMPSSDKLSKKSGRPIFTRPGSNKK